MMAAAGGNATGSCDATKCPPSHDNVEFSGNDLITPCGVMKVYYTDSFALCCQLCQGDSECGSFTWKEDLNACYLKTAGGPAAAKTSYLSFSGTMAEAPGAASLQV